MPNSVQNITTYTEAILQLVRNANRGTRPDQRAVLDEDRFRQFVIQIQAAIDAINFQGKELETVKKLVAGLDNTITIVKNNPPAPEPVPPSAVDEVQIATSTVFEPGTLVYYSGETLKVADALAGDQSNWYVHAYQDGNVTLRKFAAEIDVLETGTGTDGTGRIYLYTSGGVTRNQAQVMSSGGKPVVPGAKLQIVGNWNGLSSEAPDTGYLRGAIVGFPGVA